MFKLVFVFICVLLTGNATARIDSLVYRCLRNPLPYADSLYRDAGVKGSFLLFDLDAGFCYSNDFTRCEVPFTPASTFKIFNTLASVQAGVIKTVHDTIQWDGVQRRIAAWNRDHSLRSAFRHSVVWYYQELARRIGKDSMLTYIHREHYGNENAAGSIDSFWLSGPLRVSQFEQIAFLRKIIEGASSFSERAVSILKTVMLARETDTYALWAKTGWGNQGDCDIGWYVGWVETNKGTALFANNIQSPNPDENFGAVRISITEKILQRMGFID